MRNQGLLRVIWLTHEIFLEAKDDHDQNAGGTKNIQQLKEILEDASHFTNSETDSNPSIGSQESNDESEIKIPNRNYTINEVNKNLEDDNYDVDSELNK